jgi:hypothetical protein
MPGLGLENLIGWLEVLITFCGHSAEIDITSFTFVLN